MISMETYSIEGIKIGASFRKATSNRCSVELFVLQPQEAPVFAKTT
jgi:hypothetical protein